MINSLYIAETGLNAQRTFVDVISNNIANTNTVGYKKSRVNFIDLVSKQDENASITSDQNVMGVRIGSVDQDFSQGPLKPTGRPLDIAINGEGFLEVIVNGQNVGYTRIGRLSLNSEGALTMQGYQLSSNIIIPPDVIDLQIDKEGMVKGMLSNDDTYTEFGQIELTKFSNASGLLAQGDGIYVTTEESGEKTFGIAGRDGLGRIQQGYSEESNVSMIEEMVNLTIAQRSYQLNARVIQIADQLLETINNLRR